MDPRQDLFNATAAQPTPPASAALNLNLFESPTFKKSALSDSVAGSGGGLSIDEMLKNRNWVAGGAAVITVVILLFFSSSLLKNADGNYSFPTILAVAIVVFIIVLFGPDLRATYLNAQS